MKYHEKEFNDSVQYYINKLKGRIEKKLILVLCDLENKDAFFSIAPLSRAVHELNGEMHVIVNGKDYALFLIMNELWQINSEIDKKIKNEKTIALNNFIGSVNKRTKSNYFKNIFKRPEYIINSENSGFNGDLCLDYKNRWYKPYKWEKLLETAENLIVNGFDLKENERFSIGFELIPRKKDMGLPLEDYLDSYSIAMAMAEAAIKRKATVKLSSSTVKFSMINDSVRSADLMSTLIGCELDKDVNEDVFKKFKVLSNLIKSNRIMFNDASFGIHGKGYSGRLFFGENVGYPTLDRKTRWSSPAQMMLKDRYEAQTKYETRDPVIRYALTETLPIDIFIETCNVDYDVIRRRSEKIKAILDKCDKVVVKGKKMKGLQTNFVVDLVNKTKKIRRYFIASDSDVRSKIDEEYYKQSGIKAGLYANFPSGEVFTTPEKIEGIIVGDVVVNVDQSYRLSEKKPLVLKVKDYNYKIIQGPKDIVKKMIHEKKDCMKKIKSIEKQKALPKSITEMYKRCFNYMGEFAVNLNPKAKVCDYLIVNEKIAKMMHVAMGMGFEPDRKTMYHWDMVINAPRQKMDVYGIDSKGKEYWVIKNGEFVV